MPETTSTAQSAEQTRKWLEALPAVQSTGANLSSYRKILRPLARLTDSWLGTMAPSAPGSLASRFYPVARVANLILPEADKTGRLQDVMFLKGASTIYDNSVKDHARHTLHVGTPRLPFAECPGVLDDVAACNACEHWGHCTTWQMTLGILFSIKIQKVHFRKVCEYGTGWRKQGESVKQLSYRYTTPTAPKYASLQGADLQALPQFEPHY
jgi:hypothetical protein